MNTRRNNFDLLARPVAFVTASKEGDNFLNSKRKNAVTTSNLTGKEVKKIYEEIINDDEKKTEVICNVSSQASASTNRRKLKRKLQKSQKIDKKFVENDFFKAAQSGDLETVESCLEISRLDINSKDQYSWTPLMMAAHEGHEDVVLLLLKEGAEWTDVVDGSGYDARELACLGGHNNIADILTNSKSYVRTMQVEESKRRISARIKREKIWCEICKCYYHATVEKATSDPHTSSTLHLFSDKNSLTPCHSHFYLSGDNKGYRLMREGGWDGESGLGPERDGQKYPVKTVLKRDRLGLGADKKIKPRVTHFGANDKNAVKRGNYFPKNEDETLREFNLKTKRKNYISEKEAKIKEKEMNFRRLFY